MRLASVLSIVFLVCFYHLCMSGAARRETAKVAPPSVANVKAAVKPYRVSTSLAEVRNLRDFKPFGLTKQQKAKLAQNLFVASPTDAEQLFYIYENNDYLKIPSFVTTDSVLQLYHIFFDFTLRRVEAEKLLPLLKDLTKSMFEQSVTTYRHVADARLKRAALRNAAFFAVAAGELELSVEIPAEAKTMVQSERALIAKHEGFASGAIFPYKIDYSQFVPRGHYTRSTALKRYFKSMMWYGLAPFAVRYGDKDGRTVRADDVIRQGLLLVRGLYQAKQDDTWERIYEPTAFYVGTTDDHTPSDWRQAISKVYGENPTAGALADTSKLDAFVAEVDRLRKARIQGKFTSDALLPAPDVQLRFFGQRYIPDSEILQRLSVPVERPFPSGLDVMTVLGSARAEAILDANPKIYNVGNWEGYVPEREKVATEFGRMDTKEWTKNLYNGWLFSLKALLLPTPNGYPSFMRNDPWHDKSLNTALASWSELRHDTILYAKQSVVECGEGEEKLPKGYVEPNITFYSRLLQLARSTKDGLAKRKLLSANLREKFDSFEDLIDFMLKISIKELTNKKLSTEEYRQIQYIGGSIERLTLGMMEGNANDWQLVAEADRNMACIADVHTAVPKVLEEGVGMANEIFVIVPVEGKLTLTRGASFSYYEFTQPISDRLTDEAWQKMIKQKKNPQPPFWTKSFLSPSSKVKRPKGLAVYSSGC